MLKKIYFWLTVGCVIGEFTIRHNWIAAIGFGLAALCQIVIFQLEKELIAAQQKQKKIVGTITYNTTTGHSNYFADCRFCGQPWDKCDEHCLAACKAKWPPQINPSACDWRLFDAWRRKQKDVSDGS